MVTVASPQPNELEQKKRRQTLERAKANHLSRQLQMRLRYAKLKVEHGWQRQNLNEVENLYFHHSHLRAVRPMHTSPALPDRSTPANDVPSADPPPQTQPMSIPTPVLVPLPASRPPSVLEVSDPSPYARLVRPPQPPLATATTAGVQGGVQLPTPVPVPVPLPAAMPVSAPAPAPPHPSASALTYDSFWSTHATTTGPTRALYRHAGFSASAAGGNVAMLTPGGHAAVMTAEGVYVGGGRGG